MAKKSTTTKGKGKARKGARSKQPHLLRTLRQGTPLSVEMFKRHAWFILISVVVIIGLLGQRYTNQTKMLKIKQLNKELAQAQSDEVNAKADYMSLIREEKMRELLRSKHLDLDYQEQPPYVIHQE